MDKAREVLTEKDRAVITDRWAELALAVYPPDTVRIFLTQRDRFRNPVGSAIRRNLGILVDRLLAGDGEETMAEALDEIIRIRSVQELSARQAVRFVGELKQVLREYAKSAPGLSAILPELENRVDELVWQAFDVYVACREDIYRVRANQQRAYSEKLIERAEKIIQGRLDDRMADANSEDNGMIQRGEHQ